MKVAPAALACILFAVSVAATDLPGSRPDRVGMSADRLDRITEMTQRYVDEDKLAGVVTLIARDGKIVHFEAVGSRGADDDRPLRKDALFRIYSMTKPVVSAAAMMLYEEGRFHLSDPVTKYVPELEGLDVLVDGKRIPSEQTMTVQHLLTHTAGLSYGFNPNDPVDKLYNEAAPLRAKDLDEFAEKLATLPLKFEPGTQWHYSVSVDVLGLVIERISGQTLDVFLQERMFGPLGMADTFFSVPKAKIDRFLPNHSWDREKEHLVMFERGRPGAYENVTMFSGGGGLVSTASDYLRFAEMLRNGGSLDGVRLLSPKTIDYMTQDHLPGSISAFGSGETPAGRGSNFAFGLGFGIVADPVRSRVLSSRGEYSWGGAAGTIFWIDPVEDIVAIAMIQLMGSPWPLRSDLKVLVNQSIVEMK